MSLDRILIKGGRPLHGDIAIRGAKNAGLPLMTAGLLTDERLVLSNVPLLADLDTMGELLAQHGIAVERVDNEGRVLSLGGRITNTVAPYDIVRKMRASILVLGPLLARCREAKVSLPGGCAIGARPVDLHLKGLEQMGATIRLEGGYVHAAVPQGLQGADILFPFVSVGATENLLMAASLAQGRTVLSNAAREPEISDLADCLVAMGARIEGIGTDQLTIEGVATLHGAAHPIVPDRIETGTYACAAGIAGGEVRLLGARLDHMAALAVALAEAGVEVCETEGGLLVRRANGLHGTDMKTEPYPGFPDRHAGAVHVADVGGRGGGDDHRDDLREPFHARAGAEPDGRAHQRARLVGHRARRAHAAGRAGDGDRSAGQRFACAGGVGGARGDHRQPGLSSRSGV